jgi:hypothetical protein
MGADGRIHIWPEDRLVKEWPSHPDLFEKIKSLHFHVIRNEMAGLAYWHIYGATGFREWYDVAQDDEWSARPPRNETQLTEFLKMREFVKWLKANATVWEVWT